MTDKEVFMTFFDLVEARCNSCHFKPKTPFSAGCERCLFASMRNYPEAIRNKKNRLDDFLKLALPDDRTNRLDYPRI